MTIKIAVAICYPNGVQITKCYFLTILIANSDCDFYSHYLRSGYKRININQKNFC